MQTDQQPDALELSPDEMRRLGYRVVDQIVEHFATLGNQPAIHTGDPAQLAAALGEPLPAAPTSVDALLEQLQRDVWPSVARLNHPRFFGFIPTPSNFVSVLADMLVSGFNPFVGTWISGSAATQIELVTIGWLRELCGFPTTANGHFVSGGSTANLTALATARHVKLGNQLANAVVYCSDQTHSSLERALRILGFAPTQLRKLPADADLRLPMAALAAAVAQDRVAGLRPFCVIANAGTTNTGAIDPLDELADFCQANDLWLHVDGAYGAAAVLCERGKQLLRGLERADSLSLDPHKWLFQPNECGCVLVRDGQHLRAAFHIMADYLKDTQLPHGEVNICEQGTQLTRGFRALKVWLSFKAFGVTAFRQAVERGFVLAEFTEQLLRAAPEWEIVAPAHMGIVAFRFVPPGQPSLDESTLNELTHHLVSAMTQHGYAFASSTTLFGKTVLRFCTINPRTTEADIRTSLDWIAQLAHELLAQEQMAATSTAY